MIDIQISAADVVGATLEGRNLDRALEMAFKRRGDLPREARSAVQSIAFDTLRHYGLLAAQLDTLLTIPLTDVRVRYLLLVVLAQLQFSRAKPHVIVSHAVSACEAMGFTRAKGLVNGVLRNFLREPEKFKRERFKSDIARYDFPDWWIARMREEYPQKWEAILLSARYHPPMCLRINARKTTLPDYLALLAKNGISADQIGPDAILLETPRNVDAIPGFREGLASVQDAGAQIAARLLEAKNGMRVLDACAAPGGKTGHLLERANIALTALDSDAKRLQQVRQNLDRLGLQATLKVADAANLETWWDGKPYERILLDAPCTGSGVVRRHPDIKWIRRHSDIAKFAAQQQRLLQSLWRCLAPGGRLLYATCSLFDEENNAIVSEFLAKQPEATRLSTREAAGVYDNDNDGRVLPNDDQDGFYYALLQKR